LARNLKGGSVLSRLACHSCGAPFGPASPFASASCLRSRHLLPQAGEGKVRAHAPCRAPSPRAGEGTASERAALDEGDLGVEAAFGAAGVVGLADVGVEQ